MEALPRVSLGLPLGGSRHAGAWAAALRPPSLALANRAWLRLGLLLHRVVNPLVMAILFYLAVMPIGLLLRVCGKDVLRLKLERTAESYWIVRTDERPISQSLRQQF